ncbi:EamA family transporter, partial [Burkholderia territorii]
MNPRNGAILVALTAAALFGAATPLAKALIGAMSPFMVAGLFYLGSGIGLGVGILLRGLRRARVPAADAAPLQRSDLPWLAGAIAAG